MKTTVIEIGDRVVCDMCDEDYTGKPDKGGILFGSYAVCPACQDRVIKSAKECGETHYITQTARPDETFQQFCLRLRNGNNTITITSF